MSKVTIYQFETYDVHHDIMKKSLRWGMPAAIERIVGGKVLYDTGIEVDISEIEAPLSNIPGLTSRAFNPAPREGIQAFMLANAEY